MDFVQWCDAVLRIIYKLVRQSPDTRMIGVDHTQVSHTLFGAEALSSHFWESDQHTAVVDAFTSLAACQLISDSTQSNYYRVTERGREHMQDPVPVWEQLCHQKLEAEQEHFVTTLNKLSTRTTEHYSWLQEVEGSTLVQALGWEQQLDLVQVVAQELLQNAFIGGYMTMGQSAENVRVHASYAGLVWETRRGFTIESRLIDQLVQVWETTSVDFKREVHLDTKDQKAEFVKDVLGLANTQASGQRWLIIGFDDRTHHYYGGPSPTVTTNRIEQILTNLTTPIVSIRYHVADYRLGKVGMLEVLRTAQHLPYAVAQSVVGERKHIEKGKIFVRHGTQTEEPTPLELQALHDEAAFYHTQHS